MLGVVIILKTYYTEAKANVRFVIITIFARSFKIKGKTPKHVTFVLVEADESKEEKELRNPPATRDWVPCKGQE